MGGRQKPVRWACWLVLLGACAFEWDGYDPRLRPAGSGASEPCEPGQARSCYDGPEGTEGVGICAPGTQACEADGIGFGACEGAVTPAVERCDTPEDEDCDGETGGTEDGCVCTPGQSSACYEGPPATLDVGVCRSGQSLCQSSDSGFVASCAGQVLPLHEECPTSEDDDCDGVANDWCGVWATHFGNGQDNRPFAMALAAGELALAGHTLGTSIDFGGGPHAIGGSGDAFVLKLQSASGAHLWSRLLGASQDAEAWAMAVDAAGDLYVAGWFSGTLAPGGAVAQLAAVDAQDAFVVKLDGASGSALWAWHGGGLANERANGVAVAPSGEVIVAGEFDGSLDLGGSNTAQAFDADSDGFIIALSALGAPIWSKTFGQAGPDMAAAAAIAANGNIIVGGRFDEHLDLGGGASTDDGGYDGFVSELDLAGGHVWTHRIGAAGSPMVAALDVDASGHVIVAGDFTGTIDPGGGSRTALASSRDVFVLELDAGGAFQWDFTIGSALQDTARDVAAAGSGERFVAITFRDDLDVGGMRLWNAGSDDWLLLTLDAAGAAVRARRFGNGGDQDLHAVALEGSDALIAGECAGAIDVGLGQVWSSGGDDICAARLTP